ncbi:DUF2474 family protein [Thalassolituus alkanivorans]|nr:DUF2474 domain-containing protein [Thalassolituus alkanivorans]MCB2424702.1 DUF2474 domain-containing protein [Thalassolituus alkanivorans]
MKKSLHQWKWLLIYWALGVGALFVVATVIRFVMTLAGMESG